MLLKPKQNNLENVSYVCDVFNYVAFNNTFRKDFDINFHISV